MTPRKLNQLTALLILTGGAVIRWNYGDFSFSNDELSAICRLNFSSIGDLWKYGVKTDGHPALVQTFMWLWIQIFPATEWSLRLPFVITGIASVWLTYVVCKKWMGDQAALLAMACMAFLEFPVVYSLIARPYPFGLFFTLLTVFYLQKYAGENDKPRKWLTGFILSAVAAMYTHYFSFLQVLLIMAGGLLILKRKQILPYLIACIITAAGFVPHIVITLDQMGRGGVSWLGKPGKDWLAGYLDYVFNHDILIYGTLVLLFFTGWGCYLLRKQFSRRTFLLWLILAAWAILPFITGYFYSRYRVPVLQYSLLLFSFPFMLMVIAMPLAGIPERMARIITWIFPVLLAFSTLTTNYHFRKDYFGVFRPIAENMQDFRQQHGNDGVIVAGFNNACYLDHYFQQWKQENPTDVFYGENGDQDLSRLHEILRSGKKYAAFGWSNIGVPSETRELVRYYLPYMNRRQFHVNSEYYEFSGTPGNGYTDDLRWRTVPGDSGWEIDSRMIKKDTDGHIYYDMTGAEYGLKCSIPLGNYHSSRFTLVTARCKITRRKTDASATSPTLVAEIKRNGQNIHYRSKEFAYFNSSTDTSGLLMVSFPLYMPDIRIYKDTLNMYLWNPDKTLLQTSDWAIEAREFNPIIHGYHKGGQ